MAKFSLKMASVHQCAYRLLLLPKKIIDRHSPPWYCWLRVCNLSPSEQHWVLGIARLVGHGPLFGMDFIDYFGWYWEGGGHELLNEAYQQRLKMNVVSFQVHPEGPQAMGWLRRRSARSRTSRARRYRIYAAGAEVYSKLGIASVVLAGGEIVPALERGAIDGAEWINCYDDKILGWTRWPSSTMPLGCTNR